MCEIILFPGVRYERWTEPPQAAAPPAKAKKSLGGRKPRAKKSALEMAD